MKSFTKSIRFAIVSLAIGLVMGFLNAAAQEPPPDLSALSDVVGVVLQKSTNNIVAIGSLTEDMETTGTPLDLFVPGVVINSHEPGPNNPIISDQWTIQPYRIHMLSDFPGSPGLLPRTAANGFANPAIPIFGAELFGSAGFLPVSMRFTSDADFGTQTESDTLDITIAGAAALSQHFSLFEFGGGLEATNFFIQPLQFDMYEDGLVSDYVDIDYIFGQVLSDAETGGNIQTNIPPGFQGWDFVESATGPSFIDYDIVVHSDEVPEPSPFALVALAFGGAALGYFHRRRRERKQT
jgi:hypothetical protein